MKCMISPLLFVLMLSTVSVSASAARLDVRVRLTTGDAAKCDDVGVGAAAYTADLSGQIELRSLVPADRNPLSDALSHQRVTLTGSVTWAMCEARCPDGGCGGACTWSGSADSGSVVIETDHEGRTEIRLIHPIESRQGSCELMHDPGEMEEGLEVDWKGASLASLKKQQTFPIIDTYGQGRRGTITVVLDRKPLRAIPGGPYGTPRASSVTIDGSRSTGEIAGYEWTLTPVDCPDGVSAPLPVKHSGPGVAVTPLCSMNASLRVWNDLEQDEASVLITVAPRRGDSWITSVTHVTDWTHSTPWEVPRMRWINKETGTAKLDHILGENWCAEDDKPVADAGGIIHPHRGYDDTWLDDGYTLAQVSDENSPFHGWWYVDATTLVVSRKAVFNQQIRKTASPPTGAKENFYQANKSKGVDADAFLASVERHEGWGTKGKPTTGHTQAMKEIIDEQDPARELEEMIGPDRKALQKKADTLIREIDDAMFEKSSDPLAGRWDDPYWIWNSDDKVWDQVPAGTLKKATASGAGRP